MWPLPPGDGLVRKIEGILKDRFQQGALSQAVKAAGIPEQMLKRGIQAAREFLSSITCRAVG